MTRKGEAVTLSLLPHQKARLEELAAAHDCWWGDRPSISGFIQKIADGDISIPGSPPGIKRRRDEEIEAIAQQGLSAIESALSEAQKAVQALKGRAKHNGRGR